MFKILLILVAVLMAKVFAGTPGTWVNVGQTPDCGRRSSSKSLADVGEVNQGDWPWYVSVYENQYNGKLNYRCAGTLIGRTTVLTVAHCVYNMSEGNVATASKLKVVLNEYIQTGSELREKEVSEVIVHPEFSLQTHQNDNVAILKLRWYLRFDDKVQPACLWDETDSDVSKVYGQTGTFVSWQYHDGKRANNLVRIQAPIVSRDTCLKSFPSEFQELISEKSLCAGNRIGPNACAGDSGSGLLIPRNDENSEEKWYLRGLVSLSKIGKDASSCNEEDYIIYTDTAQYIPWIKEHM